MTQKLKLPQLHIDGIETMREALLIAKHEIGDEPFYALARLTKFRLLLEHVVQGIAGDLLDR